MLEPFGGYRQVNYHPAISLVGDYLVALEPGCFGSLRKGQSQRATVVNVVSREFESVLVEQNHCHGLRTVKKS
jgi:hypothetical protein